MVKFKDYYQTLGVPRSATDKEIKAAYRKLARQHHPDSNQGNKASEEKFKEIGEAYEVLKDPEKRKRYDMLGSNYQAGADFRPPPDFGGFSFDFGNLGGMGGGGRGGAFSDFFDMVFGQSFGGAPGGQNPFKTQPGGIPPQMNPRRFDQEAEIDLTIEELVKGSTRTLQITAPGEKPKTLEVKIPPGVRAGSKVRVHGEGSKSGAAKGDLYLKVRVKPHPVFTIDGDNLVCEATLTPPQAVIGAEIKVPTIDSEVSIRVPAGTQAGRMLRMRGKGLPRLKGDVRGDQMVRVKITIPATLSDEERSLYEQLARLEKDKSK